MAAAAATSRRLSVKSERGGLQHVLGFQGYWLDANGARERQQGVQVVFPANSMPLCPGRQLERFQCRQARRLRLGWCVCRHVTQRTLHHLSKHCSSSQQACRSLQGAATAASAPAQNLSKHSKVLSASVWQRKQFSCETAVRPTHPQQPVQGAATCKGTARWCQGLRSRAVPRCTWL